MDFRRIEYFLKVADTMNISRAAEALNISHQGLSKQIRLLEQDLGTALLERNSGGISLTEAGKKMNEWFRPISSEANYRYSKLLEYVDQKKSTLQLGYFNALSYRKCARPVMQYLQEIQPSLQVEVLAADIGQVRRLLYKDVIDLAITVMLDPVEWDDVSYQVLGDIPLKIIVSEKHPWYEREFVTREDLLESSLLYYADGSAAVLSNMKVKEYISAPNFDSYIGRLDEGKEFGVIADVYSQREGNFRLLDLPDGLRQDAWVIMAYRNEHPLCKLLKEVPDYLIGL